MFSKLRLVGVIGQATTWTRYIEHSPVDAFEAEL